VVNSFTYKQNNVNIIYQTNFYMTKLTHSAASTAASTLSVVGGGTNCTWDNTSLTGTTRIQSTLRVDGDAEFDGDVRVQGQSITQAINKINERLNILVPNEKLEQDWRDLAKLRQQYVELERELLEKQRVFDILKKSY